jgi:hypothetical protein
MLLAQCLQGYYVTLYVLNRDTMPGGLSRKQDAYSERLFGRSVATDP